VNNRDASAVAAHPLPAEGGGSIPAASLLFCSGDEHAARSLVMRFHYSRRWPSNVQFIATSHLKGGLIGIGEPVAAAVFCIPATRWSEPCLELSRLVRGERKLQLTAMLAWAVRQLRHRGEPLLVSFADKTQGHEGYVYRAANWNEHGDRDRAMDGLVVNGDFVTGRNCNHLWGTRSPERLREKYPGWNIEPHYDEGKRLFWLALNEAGRESARRLKLKETQ
jgi:hypothetical protein